MIFASSAHVDLLRLNVWCP